VITTETYRASCKERLRKRFQPAGFLHQIQWHCRNIRWPSRYSAAHHF